VVSGVATVTKGEEILALNSNSGIFIPVGIPHRLTNDGDSLLEVVDVQTGDYLSEDDIVRLADRYRRQVC